MATQDNLIKTIPAGENIKSWIMLGAHNIDFSEKVVGLTFFEDYTGTTQVGLTAMQEVIAAAQAVMTSQPHEGESCEFLGTPGFWNLVRGPELYLSWGTYNIKNHLGVSFLSNLVEPAQPGQRLWRLTTRMYQRVLAAINGEIVFDSANSRGEVKDGMHHYTFAAELGACENRLTMGLFRLGRFAQVGLRLECDSELVVCAPLPEGISLEDRLKVEQELSSIRFERDIFYPHQAVGFHLGSTAASSTPGLPHLHVELLDKYHHAFGKAQPTQTGMVSLCPASSLEDKPYTIICTWKTSSGAPLTSTSFIVRKVTPVEAPLGYERIDERRKLLLDFFGKHIEPDAHSIWREVALYASGQYERMDMETLRRTCDFIAKRNDCSDFVIQAILRIMYWERAHPRLSPEINALMKDTILGFKYWIDEPGDTVMYMGSENHRLLFHVAEWMAGMLFPLDEFTNSRQNGLFHYQKAYVYITEWLRQRGRYGFDEWHSNSYLPVCISPLLNLYDFSTHEGQYKLRQMVQSVLDQVFFYLAADTFEGFWGTTHGRSYGIYVKYADFDGTAPCCWILYGTGAATITTSTNIVTIDIGNMAPVSLATSTYKPPKMFYDIAHDQTSVVEAKQRQGILRGTARNANFVVYRTPDYMISGLQDYHKGEYETSTHIGQITLANKAIIFFSCPHTTGEGSGLRPDYWSGHTTLPRLIQHKNVMALTWKLAPFAWMSHCWLEPARFNEVLLEDNWAFARSGDGYVGIYSQHGLQWGDYGQYAGRELQCTARKNTWLVECGRKADWGSFEAFQQALKAAKIEAHAEVIHYHSPSIGEFVTGWDISPTVGGQPIQLHGYPLYDSPWAHAGFGEGLLDIHYGEEQYEIWFNQ